MKKIKRYLKHLGLRCAIKHINGARYWCDVKTDRSLLYGPDYIKTMEYQKIDIAEKISLFKFELVCAIFRLEIKLPKSDNKAQR